MFQYLHNHKQYKDALRDASNFDYVYVSIGSKMNEEHIHFNREDITIKSNSMNQMIPQFLDHQPSDVQQLVIIFDSFDDLDLRKQNLKYFTDDAYTRENAHYMVVNTKINEKNLDVYICPILKKLNEYQLDCTNFIIANYVCYKRGTEQECEYSLEMPKIVFNMLCKPEFSTYSGCLYQWYGYAYYTYNYIYNYKNYNMTQLINARSIHQLLSQLLKTKMLTPIREEVITLNIDKKDSLKWEQFLANSISFV